MKKYTKLLFKRLYFYYRFYTQCPQGDHRFIVNKTKIEDIYDECKDCGHSVPHKHVVIKWELTARRMPATMGRFALLNPVYLFKGVCRSCGETVEELNADIEVVQVLNERYLHLGNESNEQIKQVLEKLGKV